MKRFAENQDYTARILSATQEAQRAAAREAALGCDEDERDELYAREFARVLDMHGVDREQLRQAMSIIEGCERARRREAANAAYGRAASLQRERAATRQRERNRKPDLFERVAADAVAGVARWHIAYQTAADGALVSATIQGWKPSTRFVGKPQGEFIVLQWHAHQGHGGFVDASQAGTWSWPSGVGHVTCTALPSRSLRTQDDVVLAALRATAFDTADEERHLRAALCAAADVTDPALLGGVAA